VSKSTKTILENEKKLLQDVLEECGWNKKEAARRLGISRSALYGKLKRYKIDNPTIH
jgi:two-component system response regulator HydG